MVENKLGRFQPKLWQKAAAKGDLRAVLDEADTRGHKNKYIDTLHKQQLAKALALEGNEVILDFGSGIGRISSWLAPRCQKVIGIDVTPAMIQKSTEINTHTNVEYRLYDGLHIPTEKEYFDRLVSVYVLQHITEAEDFIKIVKEFNRVLKIGGKACLIEQVSMQQAHEAGMPEDFNVRRKPMEYIDAFGQNGFHCDDWRLIRTSTVFTYLAEQPFFPSFLLPILAVAEAQVSQFRDLARLTYADCLFILVKKQGDALDTMLSNK